MACQIVGAACSTIGWSVCCRQDRGIPRSANTVTAAFLTRVLRSEGVLELDKSVVAVEVRAVGEMDKGLTSDTAFLGLKFDGETKCPRSMLCKTAGSNIDMRILMKLLNMVGAEIGFLRMQRDERSTANLRVPQLYYAHHNQRTEQFLILMQDMRPARPGKQLQGCHISEAHGVLKLLAKLHGHYWENYGAAHEWTVLPNHPKKRFLNVVLSKSWPKFIKWASPHVKAGNLPTLEAAVQIAQEVLASKGEWLQVMATAPLSVIHGDCHSENYLWPQDADASADEVIAIDWQLSTVGQPLFDVANFLVLSLEGASLQQQEEDLLLYYHTQLKTHICEEFTMEELRSRYTAGLCYTLVLEAVSQATMSAAELANRELQGKRIAIFGRILNALNRIASPSFFFTRRSIQESSAPLL